MIILYMMTIDKKEGNTVSDPNVSVRMSPELQEEVKRTVGIDQLATAIRKAVKFCINHWNDVSKLSKLSLFGQELFDLPNYITVRETTKILNEHGIKVSRRTVSRWCVDGKNITAQKSEGETSPWFVDLMSVISFIENRRPDINNGE